MKEIIYCIYSLKEKNRKGIPWQFSCQDFSAFSAKDWGSIPGQGTKISKGAQHGQKETVRKEEKEGGKEGERSKRVNGYQGLSHSVQEIEHHLYREDLWGPLNGCFPLLTQKNNC